MQKVAIIDIGSNSIRLVLFEIYKNHSFRVIDDIKESPRLGEGIFANGLMKQENMDKALETLVLFRSLWEHRGVTEILAFATEAVRTAKNSKEFLDRIKKNCNIDVTVLSGEEEAKYSFIIAICRGLLLVSVAVIILPIFMGINGVWVSVPVAEAITFIIGIMLTLKMRTRKI